MGATVCDAVAAADGLELVAAIDVVGGGGSVHGVPVHGELKALARTLPGTPGCVDTRHLKRRQG